LKPSPQRAISDGGSLGRLLKDWRGRRGLSQLALAVAARTTQRHLSFIESGRAAPSRDMVLRLGASLSLPLRQQNALLLAAGYAPAWKERDLATPDLAVVNSALDYMLAQHEPYPAFVIDRCWNLLRANRGALSLTEFLTAPAPPAPPSESVNHGRRIAGAGRAASFYRKLAGSRSPLHTRRGGGCACRWDAGNG
jgi:transcriptional regulator with XRE-family HTH domain